MNVLPLPDDLRLLPGTAGVGDVQEFRASVDQLRVGVFIRREMAWFERPFLFGSFKIKSIVQIATLK